MPTAIATTATLMCAKCGHINDAASRRCASCRAHLPRICRHCGVVNDFAAGHCHTCGTRLHRSFWRRLKSRLRRRVKPLEVAIIIAGIIVLIVVVITATRKKADVPASPTSGVSGDAVQY